jgi:hypothetical protein
MSLCVPTGVPLECRQRRADAQQLVLTAAEELAALVRLVAETWDSAISTCIALELPPAAAYETASCTSVHPHKPPAIICTKEFLARSL